MTALSTGDLPRRLCALLVLSSAALPRAFSAPVLACALRPEDIMLETAITILVGTFIDTPRTLPWL